MIPDGNCRAKNSQTKGKIALCFRVRPSPSFYSSIKKKNKRNRRTHIQDPQVMELFGVIVEISIPVATSEYVKFVTYDLSRT